MKKIINIQTALFVIVFVLGAVVFFILREQPRAREQYRQLQSQFKESEVKRKAAEFYASQLTDENNGIKAEVIIQKNRNNELDKRAKLSDKKYDQAQKQIQALTNQQADSALTRLYPDDSTRARDILISLNAGRRSMEALAICEEKGRGLEGIIDNQDKIIKNDSLIQASLREQIAIREGQLKIKDEQLDVQKKRIRAIIWQRNGAVVLVIGITVAALL